MTKKQWLTSAWMLLAALALYCLSNSGLLSKPVHYPNIQFEQMSKLPEVQFDLKVTRMDQAWYNQFVANGRK